MKRLFMVLVAVLMFPAFAWAGSVSFGVELPTTRDDAFNTPLPLSEIATLTLQCDGKTGNFTPAGTVTVDNSWFGGAGTYTCVMLVTDTDGLPSKLSNAAIVTFAVAPPKAPVIVGVQYN